VHESAYGTSQTCELRRLMSAFGSKADVASLNFYEDTP
jgi:hypothetical protein